MARTRSVDPRVLALGGTALALALVEAWRYANLQRTRRRLHSMVTPISPSFDVAAWASFFERGMLREAEMAPSRVDAFLESAFWQVPAAELTQLDVRHWACMYLTTREMCDGGGWTAHEWAEACRFVEALEHALHRKFKRTGEAQAPTPPQTQQKQPQPRRFVRINHPQLDHNPPAPWFQPIPVAVGRRALRWTGNLALRLLGFAKRVDAETGVVFWVKRPRTPPRPDQRAMFLIPGLNVVGAVPYLALLRELVNRLADSHPTFVVFEAPGLADHPVRSEPADCPYPRSDEIVAAVQRTLQSLDLNKIDSIGHSYGGLVLTYIDNQQPQLLAKTAFMETPALLTHTSKSWPQTFGVYKVADIFWGLLTLDPNKVVTTLSFTELWHQHVLKNVIWVFEHVNLERTFGKHSLFLVSKEDEYVDGPFVESYLNKFHPNVPVKLYPGWGHGSVIMPWRYNRKGGVIDTLVEHFQSPDNHTYAK